MLQTNCIEFIADHAINTLPDSLQQRKLLLHTIVGALPKGNESRKRALCLLEQIAEHEKLQSKFTMDVRENPVSEVFL